MVAEREDGARAMHFARELDGAADDALVPDVDAVKHAERDGDARVFLCEVLEFVIDLHRHQAPVDCGFCFDSGAAMTFSGVTVAAAPSMRPMPRNASAP